MKSSRVRSLCGARPRFKNFLWGGLFHFNFSERQPLSKCRELKGAYYMLTKPLRIIDYEKKSIYHKYY